MHTDNSDASVPRFTLDEYIAFRTYIDSLNVLIKNINIILENHDFNHIYTNSLNNENN